MAQLANCINWTVVERIKKSPPATCRRPWQLGAASEPGASGFVGEHRDPAQGGLDGRVPGLEPSGRWAGKHYVYVWVDGIHFNVRLKEAPLQCILVIIGATADGRKKA